MSDYVDYSLERDGIFELFSHLSLARSFALDQRSQQIIFLELFPFSHFTPFTVVGWFLVLHEAQRYQWAV